MRWAGIYKYAEAPAGEADALDSLWLEVYLGERDQPRAFTRFAPSTLSAEFLELRRRELAVVWDEAKKRAGEGPTV